MNKLVVATLAAAASLAEGCVVETRFDDGYHDEVASISARWSLRNMIDGAVTACPSGFDTVMVVSQPIDDFGVPLAEPAADLFDCEDRAGTSTALFPDVYQVWIEVRSHDLRTLYAQSLTQVLDVRDVDRQFSAELLNDGGYFQLSWDLVGASSHRPLECAQVVGIDKIHAVSASVSTAQFTYDDWFSCEDHVAISGGLIQGPYTIAIDAVSADRSIGPAVTLTNQVISGQNRVTDLGHVLLPIDGL